MDMHSWVFRNRSRLRLIYGPSHEGCEELLPGRGFSARVPEDAGQVVRRSRYVVLRPMPPRTF